MNKKGFTLIELMAVIVVLIIIFLIAVPIVSNVTSSSKKSAAKTNAIHFIDAVEAENSTLTGTYDLSDIPYNIKGTKPSGGTFKMNNGEIEEATMCINNYKVHYDGDKTEILGKCSEDDAKTNYKESYLNGTDPVLKDDMIAVTIDNDGTVTKANTKSEWYNYEDKKWANSVVLVDNTNYEVGDTIPEEKIKAYYVWIPRYKYKLFSNTTESSIEIVFENKNTEKSEGTQVGEYRSHPAFTYGNKELNGFWVGKFEPSVETSDDCYTIRNTASCDKVLNNVKIIPNVFSLVSQRAATQYQTALNISTNSKMIKNDEWGAVAYLSHSRYGINNEIRINNNNRCKTGCGASTAHATVSTECQIAYGSATSYPQSTTGNIYGIFDMSGGAWEYVMASFADKNGKGTGGECEVTNSGFNGIYTNLSYPGNNSDSTELTTGIDYPNSKEYNLFYNPNDTTNNRTNTTVYNSCNGGICYGHALSEVVKGSETINGTESRNGWYGNVSQFRYSDSWITRGSHFSKMQGAGIFAFESHSGQGDTTTSFRVVVR